MATARAALDSTTSSMESTMAPKTRAIQPAATLCWLLCVQYTMHWEAVFLLTVRRARSVHVETPDGSATSFAAPPSGDAPQATPAASPAAHPAGPASAPHRVVTCFSPKG